MERGTAKGVTPREIQMNLLVSQREQFSSSKQFLSSKFKTWENVGTSLNIKILKSAFLHNISANCNQSLEYFGIGKNKI